MNNSEALHIVEHMVDHKTLEAQERHALDKLITLARPTLMKELQERVDRLKKELEEAGSPAPPLFCPSCNKVLIAHTCRKCGWTTTNQGEDE